MSAKAANEAAMARAADATMPIYTVHLDHADADARRAQAQEIGMHAFVASDASWSVLIAGDFNARGTEEPVVDLERAGLIAAIMLHERNGRSGRTSRLRLPETRHASRR